MYEFWCDYVKAKYDGKGTDSFIAYTKKMIILKILQKMLKQELILQILNQEDSYVTLTRLP